MTLRIFCTLAALCLSQVAAENLLGPQPRLPTNNNKGAFWSDVVRQQQAWQTELAARGGYVLFIGDSLIGHADVLQMSQVGVNLGINGDDIAGVLNRMWTYPAFGNAACVVISIGHNDGANGNNSISFIETNLALIFSGFTGCLVWLGIPPDNNAADNAIFAEVNAWASRLLAGRPRTADMSAMVWMAMTGSNGLIQPQFVWDGIHFTTAGYQAGFYPAARAGLAQLGVR